MKRFVDVVIAAVLLLALSPLWLLIALCVRLESAGPVLARPHRVGRNGRMIKVYEFRTAITDPDAMETVGGCHGEQVTRVGALLRATRLACWPLLLNVLKGDFSIVGPRAEMPRYVGCYPTEVRKRVLSVKPGLLDLSTIEFRDVRKMLEGLEGDALETAYVEQVLPRRLDYAQRYLEQRGWLTDLRIMLGSLLLPLRALRRA